MKLLKIFSNVPRPLAYSAILVAVMIAGGAYGLRRDDLFACQGRYGADRYLAYCQAKNYGDYDYGAFWFGLESDTRNAARNAQVLFLGNSRMQFGLSTIPTATWFSSRFIRHYLLGFAYNGNAPFAALLLARVRPTAKVYVINVDRFFEDSLPTPAIAVIRDSSAKSRYVRKRLWQRVHRSLCGRVDTFCGHEIGFYRSRLTGAWTADGGVFRSDSVVYEPTVDKATVEAYAANTRRFVAQLPVSRECVILTNVPTAPILHRTGIGTVNAIADAVGLRLVAPRIGGLRTFDGSHLDRVSAERWSAAFIDAAAPWIEKCFHERTRSAGRDSHVAEGLPRRVASGRSAPQQ